MPRPYSHIIDIQLLMALSPIVAVVEGLLQGDGFDGAEFVYGD